MPAPNGRRTVLERRWGTRASPLPLKWVSAEHRPVKLPDRKPFNLSAALQSLVADIVRRCPTFAHIDPAALLYTVTASRNKTRYGLLARITPLRFRNGRLYKRFRGNVYQVQRYFVNERELLYVLTVCSPRFLQLPFLEKLITIFHELYHISAEFDGDVRRHEGRYQYHTHSKKGYDDAMEKLATVYLADHPQPELFAFCHATLDQLWNQHGGVYAAKIPRPAMIPVQDPDVGLGK